MAKYDPVPPDAFAQPQGPETSAIIQYLINEGMGGLVGLLPSLSPIQSNLAQGMAPLAEDLGTTTATNAVQDQQTMLADYITMAMAGPGAFSSNAFDPIPGEAPTSTYTVVPTPNRDRIAQLASGPDSLDSFIARALLGDDTHPPLTGPEIRAQIEDMFEQYAGADPESIDPTISAVMNQVQTETQEEPGNPLATITVPNIDWLSSRIEDMETGLRTDPQPGNLGPVMDSAGNIIQPGRNLEYVQDENGNMVLAEVSTTEGTPDEMSYAAEQFQRLGLSLPTDQFTVDRLMGDDWRQALDAYMGTWGDPEFRDALLEETLTPMNNEIAAYEQQNGDPYLSDEDYARSVRPDLYANPTTGPLGPPSREDVPNTALMPENLILGGNAPPPPTPIIPETSPPTGFVRNQATPPSGGGGGAPAPQQGSPEAVMAMLRSLLPDYMSNSPMIPAVLNQIANGPSPQAVAPPPTQPSANQVEGWAPQPEPTTGFVRNPDYSAGGPVTPSTGFVRNPTPTGGVSGPPSTDPAFTLAMLQALVGGGDGGFVRNQATPPSAEQLEGATYIGSGRNQITPPSAEQLEGATYIGSGRNTITPTSGGGGTATPSTGSTPGSGVGGGGISGWGTSGRGGWHLPREAILRFIMGGAQEAQTRNRAASTGRRIETQQQTNRYETENRQAEQRSRAREQVYGADFGRNLAISDALMRAGIRPIDLELAARSQVLSQAGLRPA
jgi:hypothetical protein